MRRGSPARLALKYHPADHDLPWRTSHRRLVGRDLPLVLARARAPGKAPRGPGGDRAVVVFRSFELDPNSDPALDVPTTEMLKKKFGIGQAQIEAMHDRLQKLGAADGIEYRFDKARTSNTFDAHQLIQYAKQEGKQAAMVERLFVGTSRKASASAIAPPS